MGHFSLINPVRALGQIPTHWCCVKSPPLEGKGESLDRLSVPSLEAGWRRRRMFPLGRSPCNLFRTSLDLSCSPSFLPACFSVRAMSPPCVVLRDPIPEAASAAAAANASSFCRSVELALEMVWATTMVEGGKASQGTRGSEGGRERERGGRLGKVQRLRSPPLRADGGGAHCLARSLPRPLAPSPSLCVGQRGAAAAAAIRPTRETPRRDEGEGAASLPPSLSAVARRRCRRRRSCPCVHLSHVTEL